MKRIMICLACCALLAACGTDKNDPKPMPIIEPPAEAAFRGNWLFVKQVSVQDSVTQLPGNHVSYLSVTDSTFKQWLDGVPYTNSTYTAVPFVDSVANKLYALLALKDGDSYLVDYSLRDTIVLSIPKTGSLEPAYQSYWVRTTLPVPAP